MRGVPHERELLRSLLHKSQKSQMVSPPILSPIGPWRSKFLDTYQKKTTITLHREQRDVNALCNVRSRINGNKK